MYFLIYVTTNLENGKFYVGMHRTDNLDDGYLGSGKAFKRAVSKYGKEYFQKEILQSFDNELDMIETEKQIVTEAFCNRRDTYNICPGGKGGFGYINSSGIPKMHGKHHSEETKKKLSVASTGRTHTVETRQKMSYRTKLTNESRGKKVSAALKGRARDGKFPTDEAKRKISETLKKRVRDASIEQLEDMRAGMAHARSCKPPVTDETKRKLAEMQERAWSNGTRQRPQRDWGAIQMAFDCGMPRDKLFETFSITRSILNDARKTGIFVGIYKKK